MSDAYREDPIDDALGAPERESDAIAAFGGWRDRVRMRTLLGFAVVGVVAAAIAWYFVQDYQFAYNDGRALLVINVGSAATVWGLMFAIGAVVGRRIVRARTAEKLAWLAERYDVPIAKLQETSMMVEKL